MIQLYRPTFIREITTIKGELIRYISSGFYMSYGEPKENLFETSDWNELLMKLDYIPEFQGHKNRKGRIWCFVEATDKNSNWFKTKLYKDEFVSMKSYYTNRIIQEKDVRMEYLIKELSVEQFILFLKDHDINYFSK